MNAGAGWHEEGSSWRSGPWSLERRGDELADLAYDGRTVLRSIRAVVRDRDWNTAPWRVEGVGTSEDRMLRLDLHSQGLGSDIRAALTVDAAPDRMTVTFDAVAREDFETNRTGLVVLHPPSLAGRDLSVAHPDGTTESTRFPTTISASQPVFAIERLAWESDGLAVDLAFSGEVFEMEDQRNWTDASFKTYSRPLSLPFPYTLHAGERVVQSLVIRASGGAGSAPEASDRLVLRPAGVFPAVSVGASTAPDPAPAGSAPGSSVLVELDLASPTWRAALARAAASALALDVRFVLDDEQPSTITDGAEALRTLDVARATAFWTTGAARHVSDVDAVGLLREAIAQAGLSVPVVGGVRAHFTELNREHHRLPSDLDGVVFAITPLFHSLSTAQLVESLAMQRLVAAQAVEIARGAPVHVGPITLRPHFNDVATTPAPVSPYADLRAGYGPELIGADDDRQTSPELAAWTVASAAALSIPGVHSLSYFEQWGPRGIRSSSGDDLPAAAALDALAALSGRPLLGADSPDGLLWAIGAETPTGVTALVANLARSPRTIALASPAGDAEITVGAGGWTTVSVGSAAD